MLFFSYFPNKFLSMLQSYKLKMQESALINANHVPVKGRFVSKQTKMHRWQLDIADWRVYKAARIEYLGGTNQLFRRRQGKGLGNNKRIRPGLLKWLLSFLLLWRLAPVRARGGRWGNIIWLMGGGGSSTHAGAFLTLHFWSNPFQPLDPFAFHPVD